MTALWQKFQDLIHTRPKLSCFIAGSLASLAMAPTFFWPLLMLGLCTAALAMSRIEKPMRGAWCTFWFGMGFFIFGLYWIANALLIKIEDYWWVMGFAIFGLPLLLSICWFIAGWITVRLSKPQTLARSFLWLTLLALAEYGRAFNLTGFPWNLFGYTWGFSDALMQGASLGGAYFVTALTIFWMASPLLVWQAFAHKKLRYALGITAIASFAVYFAYGAIRLASHPTELRDDVGIVIVQPNLSQDEKWEATQALGHFMRHIRIMEKAIAEIGTDGPYKSVAFVWPETSIDESLLFGVPAAPKAIVDTLSPLPYKTTLISGIWREDGKDPVTARPRYFNSISGLVIKENKVSLETLYDKHHLVPFGEFLPMEQTFNLTPVVGFAGFQWGTGPKVLQSEIVPPYAAMICFEAVYPWYGASEGAEWLINTSNDGWYGDTPGPYQHLTMTRFRAIEQGKPIARSATTGISAMIDAYGRVVQKLPYLEQGYVLSALPKTASSPTVYTITKEALFFILILLGCGIFTHFYRKGI
ncbi:MAG: apolipoprotein N-acyltransferase [Proteobacteria bacterium]|nr:apolipoprotein N-acyltransferase [Pseudomonadota bacterium]